MHVGNSPGAPKGNRNALKHGRDTAEALASRREIVTLLRTIENSCESYEEGGLNSSGSGDPEPSGVTCAEILFGRLFSPRMSNLGMPVSVRVK